MKAPISVFLLALLTTSTFTYLPVTPVFASSDPIVIDDGDVGFSVSNPDYWALGMTYVGGYAGDVSFDWSTMSNAAATWTFANLAAGEYTVAATWPAQESANSQAIYEVRSGTALLSSVTVNQQSTPADETDANGVHWQSLASGVLNHAGGNLTVKLKYGTNRQKPIYADAVRVQSSASSTELFSLGTKQLSGFVTQPTGGIVSERVVEVNRALLDTNPESMQIAVDEGEMYTFLRDDEFSEQGVRWRGYVEGNTFFVTQIEMNENNIFGFITTPSGDTYNLRYHQGQQYLIEANLRHFSDENLVDETLEYMTDPLTRVLDEGEGESSPPVVDVLFVATPLAQTLLQSSRNTDIHAIASSEAANVNAAFMNSAINGQLRVVGSSGLNYVEINKSRPQILADLVHNGQLADLRNEHMADVVVVYVYDMDSKWCGTSPYALDENASLYSEKNFIVLINANCALDSPFLVPHEIGHIFAAGHEIDVDPITLHPWSHPKIVDGRFATMMRSFLIDYDETVCPNNCPSVPYYSNPAISEPVSGISTGEEGSMNNALTISTMFDEIRSFRDPRLPRVTTRGFPAIPTGQLFVTQMEANWGIAPYEWRVKSEETMPSWITLSKSGELRVMPNTERTLSLTFVVKDALGSEGAKTFSLIIRGDDIYRNPINCYDVSGDGIVAPNDALRIINYLTVNQAGGITDTNREAVLGSGFIDVSGDNIIAPGDVLRVINALNGEVGSCS